MTEKGTVITLSSGYQMPLLAYGLGTTWKNHTNHTKNTFKQCIKLALHAGYRHLDEAEMYHTETACGEAVKEWLSVKEGDKTNKEDFSDRMIMKRQRSDLFITSKISYSANEPKSFSVNSLLIKNTVSKSPSQCSARWSSIRFLRRVPFDVVCLKCGREQSTKTPR